MRHLKRGRKLGRNASHRTALMRNLTGSLIAKERIITTVAKAKELRPFVERLITLAKRNTLHARRLVIARLGGKKEFVIQHDKDRTESVAVVEKLFSVIAPRFADRPGGYTRIIKRPQVRLGDAGPTAFIELLKEGETKPTRAKAPAPKVAPVVSEPKAKEPEAPTPEPVKEPPPASA